MFRWLRKKFVLMLAAIMICLFNTNITFAASSNATVTFEDESPVASFVQVDVLDVFEPVQGSNKYLVRFRIQAEKGIYIGDLKLKFVDNSTGQISGCTPIRELPSDGKEYIFYRAVKFGRKPKVEDLAIKNQLNAKYCYVESRENQDSFDNLGTYDTFSRKYSYIDTYRSGYLGWVRGINLKKNGTLRYKEPKNVARLTVCWFDKNGKFLDSKEGFETYTKEGKILKIKPARKLKANAYECHLAAEPSVLFMESEK